MHHLCVQPRRRGGLRELFGAAGGSNQCARRKAAIGAGFFCGLLVQLHRFRQIARGLLLDKRALVDLQRVWRARGCTGRQKDCDQEH